MIYEIISNMIKESFPYSSQEWLRDNKYEVMTSPKYTKIFLKQTSNSFSNNIKKLNSLESKLKNQFK